MDRLRSCRDSSSLEPQPFLFTSPIRAITNRVYAVAVFVFTTLCIVFLPRKREQAVPQSLLERTPRRESRRPDPKALARMHTREGEAFKRGRDLEKFCKVAASARELGSARSKSPHMTALTKSAVRFDTSVVVATFTKAQPANTRALTDERGRVVVPLDGSKLHAAMKEPTEGFDPTEMFIGTDEICAILSATRMPPRLFEFLRHHFDKHLQALAIEVASRAITPEVAIERFYTIFGPEETSEIMRSAREEHEEDLSQGETASPVARSRIRRQLRDISNLEIMMPRRTMVREGQSIRVVHTELTYSETQTLQRWLPGFLASERVRTAILAYFNDHLPV